MEVVRSMLGQLGINESFFVMLVLFTFTFVLTSFLALKKLSRTLIEREHRTEGREDKASGLTRDLEHLRERIRHSTQEARAKANTEFLVIRSKAADEHRQTISSAREKASQELKKTRESVGLQFSSEMKKLEQDIPQISKAIIDKLLEAEGPAKSVNASLSTEME